jgi:hypothetical protein
MAQGIMESNQPRVNLLDSSPEPYRLGIQKSPRAPGRKAMTRETTYKGKVEAWERLSERVAANEPELAHLETSRAKLDGLTAQARQIAATQAAQVAAKQQSSQSMKTLISEGDRLANVLLTSIKEHYGIRSEKVAEFGAQPFRGRKPKKAPGSRHSAAFRFLPRVGCRESCFEGARCGASPFFMPEESTLGPDGCLRRAVVSIRRLAERSAVRRKDR